MIYQIGKYFFISLLTVIFFFLYEYLNHGIALAYMFFILINNMWNIYYEIAELNEKSRKEQEAWTRILTQRKQF